jgi:hypothetical protein
MVGGRRFIQGATMKTTSGLAAGLAIVFAQMTAAYVAPAYAAAPKLSGNYAFMQWSLCQASFTTKTRDYKLAPSGAAGPAVQEVDPAGPGELSVETGYLAFTATHVTGSSTIVSGSSLRLNTNGDAMHTKTEPFGAAYSVTATTMTLGSQVFTMTFGDVVNGIARTIYLVRKEDAKCLGAMSMTKSP